MNASLATHHVSITTKMHLQYLLILFMHESSLLFTNKDIKERTTGTLTLYPHIAGFDQCTILGFFAFRVAAEVE